jgi:hypothetical protein
MKVCAIHQPTFLPWLGYFDKMERCDTFVFLDRAHYQKSGKSMSSWCNRVAINVNGKASWISCPVVREHGAQPINTVHIDQRRPWRAELLATIERAYGNAPRFASIFPLVERIVGYETELLADLNIHAIEVFAREFGLRTRCIRESALPDTGETATARLIAVCRQLGADTYLSGSGSGSYLDETAFAAAGVRLVYQDFRPASYGDPATYVAGLSVLDWFMRANADESPFARQSGDPAAAEACAS